MTHSDIFYPLHYEFALTRSFIAVIGKNIDTITTEQKEKASNILTKFNYAGACKKGIYPGRMAQKLFVRYF